MKGVVRLKKRIVSFGAILICGILILTAIGGIVAIAAEEFEVPVPKLQKEVFIYDDGNFLSQERVQKINTLLIDLEKQTSIEIAVITVDSLLGQEINVYSNQLFNKIGIGKKDVDNGILILISKTDHKVILEIGRELEGIITAAKAGRILDEYFVPYREQDDYDTATEETVKAVISVLSTKYQYTPEGFDVEDYPESEGSIGKIMAWVIGILLFLFVLELITGKGRPGRGIVFLILEAMLDSDSSESSGGSSSWGSSGGSSFGGGGSSGTSASR